MQNSSCVLSHLGFPLWMMWWYEWDRIMMLNVSMLFLSLRQKQRCVLSETSKPSDVRNLRIITPVRDKITIGWMWRHRAQVFFPCHQTRAISKESKWVVLSLEQRKLLCIFDAVSQQCLWLVIEEAICSQGRNKVHDKVAYRSMAWVYNLCRVLQHVVDGFDNVSLA